VDRASIKFTRCVVMVSMFAEFDAASGFPAPVLPDNVSANYAEAGDHAISSHVQPSTPRRQKKQRRPTEMLWDDDPNT